MGYKSHCKKWVGNNNCQDKGVIFRTASSTFENSSSYARYMKTFSSMQGNEIYMPYLCIEFSSITPVSAVSLSSSSLTLDVGKTHTFYPTVYPSTATNQQFTWTSSNEAVATVSSSGKVTAKTAGTTTITVTSKANSSAEATCKVKVRMTPDEQDKYVLTEDDYITIMALKRFIFINKNTEEGEIIKNLVLQCIEEIRHQSKYDYKYDISDAKGKSINSFTYDKVPSDSLVRLKVDTGKVTAADIPEGLYNCGMFLAQTASSASPYMSLFLTLVDSGVNPPEDLLDIVFFVAELSGVDFPYSFVKTIIEQTNYIPEETEITSNDYRVVISYHPSIYSSSVTCSTVYFDGNNSDKIKHEDWYQFLGSSSALGRYLKNSPIVSFNISQRSK